MNLDSYFVLHPGIKFRGEYFGGIVYQRNKDLVQFITSRLAIALLFQAGKSTVREIATRTKIGSLSPQEVEEQILKTLASLERAGIIYEVKPGESPSRCTSLYNMANHQ